ncbi:hypothetical protein HPB49_007032 [Dermacentor silvarum]|uniref:Uncharacterized protein n=1 Tax=Dermacentor silvarum TaxID=543639 RepID=A0ACB8CQI7_DERSI|nr:hypothetical protein HPB49_007032 [Dermacentor silvarum]
MPRLPEEDYKIVLRPKCAVNLTNIGLIALLEAIYATSKINQAQAEQADQNKKTTSQSDTQTTGETRRSHSRGRTQGVFRDRSESFPPLHSREIDQSISGGNTSQQDEPAKHVAWGSGKPNLRDKTTPQVTTSLETPPEQQSRNGRTTTQTREERSGYKISQAAREKGTPTRPQQSKPQQQQDQQTFLNQNRRLWKSRRVGGIRDEEQESPEPMPSSHSIPSETTGNNSVCTHDQENLKEKPPDGDKEEEAMDSSQARKRPAPCNDETTGSAVQAPESVPSSAQRVPSPGDGVPRRFCQRSKESAIKKCKGSKTTDLPVAKGDEEQKL